MKKWIEERIRKLNSEPRTEGQLSLEEGLLEELSKGIEQRGSEHNWEMFKPSKYWPPKIAYQALFRENPGKESAIIRTIFLAEISSPQNPLTIIDGWGEKIPSVNPVDFFILAKRQGFLVPLDILEYLSRRSKKRIDELIQEQNELTLIDEDIQKEIDLAIKKQASERSKKGGKKSTLLQGVFEATQKILDNNIRLSADQVWLKLSQYNSLNPCSAGDYDIYVDGITLVQENKITGKTKSIKKTSFPRYVKKAKNLSSS